MARKLLSVLLAMVIFVQCFGVVAFAADEAETALPQEEVTLSTEEMIEPEAPEEQPHEPEITAEPEQETPAEPETPEEPEPQDNTPEQPEMNGDTPWVPVVSWQDGYDGRPHDQCLVNNIKLDYLGERGRDIQMRFPLEDSGTYYYAILMTDDPQVDLMSDKNILDPCTESEMFEFRMSNSNVLLNSYNTWASYFWENGESRLMGCIVIGTDNLNPGSTYRARFLHGDTFVSDVVTFTTPDVPEKSQISVSNLRVAEVGYFGAMIEAEVSDPENELGYSGIKLYSSDTDREVARLYSYEELPNGNKIYHGHMDPSDAAGAVCIPMAQVYDKDHPNGAMVKVGEGITISQTLKPLKEENVKVEASGRYGKAVIKMELSPWYEADEDVLVKFESTPQIGNGEGVARMYSGKCVYEQWAVAGDYDYKVTIGDVAVSGKLTVTPDEKVDLDTAVPDPVLRELILNEGGFDRSSAAPGMTRDRTGVTMGTLSEIKYLNKYGNSDQPEDEKIRDLTGLDILTGLTSLNLKNQLISDISVLANMPSLTYIGLNENKIEKIPDLSRLKSLDNLDLSRNLIQDISVLSKLTGLKRLDLDDNRITALPDLSGWKNLEQLSMSRNLIQDVSALNKLTSLKRLYLGDNRITALPDLSGWKNLERLSMSRNGLTDISALAALTNLKEIALYNNNIQKMPDFSGLTKLEELELGGNYLTAETVTANRLPTGFLAMERNRNWIWQTLESQKMPFTFKRAEHTYTMTGLGTYPFVLGVQGAESGKYTLSVTLDGGETQTVERNLQGYSGDSWEVIYLDGIAASEGTHRVTWELRKEDGEVVASGRDEAITFSTAAMDKSQQPNETYVYLNLELPSEIETKLGTITGVQILDKGKPITVPSSNMEMDKGTSTYEGRYQNLFGSSFKVESPLLELRMGLQLIRYPAAGKYTVRIVGENDHLDIPEGITVLGTAALTGVYTCDIYNDTDNCVYFRCEGNDLQPGKFYLEMTDRQGNAALKYEGIVPGMYASDRSVYLKYSKIGDGWDEEGTRNLRWTLKTEPGYALENLCNSNTIYVNYQHNIKTYYDFRNNALVAVIKDKIGETVKARLFEDSNGYYQYGEPLAEGSAVVGKDGYVQFPLPEAAKEWFPLTSYSYNNYYVSYEIPNGDPYGNNRIGYCYGVEYSYDYYGGGSDNSPWVSAEPCSTDAATVDIYGFNLKAGTTYTILLEGKQIGSAKADTDGYIDKTVSLPSGLTVGYHSVALSSGRADDPSGSFLVYDKNVFYQNYQYLESDDSGNVWVSVDTIMNVTDRSDYKDLKNWKVTVRDLSGEQLPLAVDQVQVDYSTITLRLNNQQLVKTLPRAYYYVTFKGQPGWSLNDDAFFYEMESDRDENVRSWGSCHSRPGNYGSDKYTLNNNYKQDVKQYGYDGVWLYEKGSLNCKVDICLYGTVEPVKSLNIKYNNRSYNFTKSDLSGLDLNRVYTILVYDQGTDYKNCAVEEGYLAVSDHANQNQPTIYDLSEGSITLSAEEFAYTGSDIKPTVTVKDGNGNPVAATNLVVSYQNNREPGTGTVTVTHKSTNWTGSLSAEFTILPAKMEKVTVTVPDVTYGAAPVVTAKLGTLTLTKDKDYTLSVSGDTAGVQTVTLTAVEGSNFSGEVTKSFTVKPKVLTAANLALDSTSVSFLGDDTRVPALTVTDGENLLKEDVDYTVTMTGNPKAIGTVTLTVSGSGNYTGKPVVKYSVTKASLADNALTVIRLDESNNYTYTGAALKPKVVVLFNESQVPLEEDVDYTLSYKNNIKAHTVPEDGVVDAACPTIIVTGKGSYTGTNSIYFPIEPAELKDAEVTAKAVVYNCKAQTPVPTVKIGKVTLKANVDYKLQPVEGEGFVNAGDHTFAVEGMGNYTGVAFGSFTINPKAISSAARTLAFAKTPFLGINTAKPAVTVKDKAAPAGADVLTEGNDYKVEYLNAYEIGTAKAVITGTGNYTGSVTQNYTITKPDLSLLGEDDCTVNLYDDRMLDGADGFTVVYDGTDIKPVVSVNFFGEPLTLGKDYTVAYKNTKAASEGVTSAAKLPTVTITGKGDYIGKYTLTYTILKQDLNACQLNVVVSNVAKEGAKPAIKVYDMTTGKDFPAANYNASVNTENHTVTISGKGNYEGEMEPVSYEVKVLPVSKLSAVLTASGKSKVYDPNAPVELTQEDLTVTVKVGKEIRTLNWGTDYEVTFLNNNQAGKASAVITYLPKAEDDFVVTAPLVLTYNIAKATLTLENIELESEELPYSGKAQTPAVTVTYNGNPLVEGVDYTLKYANNTNVSGTKKATVTVTGKGNYVSSSKAGEKPVASFVIDKIDISQMDNLRFVVGNVTKATATPAVKVYDAETGKQFAAGNYTVKKNADGTSVTIAGKGNYTGEKVFDYEVVSTLITASLTASGKAKTYCLGEPVKLTAADLTIKAGKTGIPFEDCGIDYLNNTDVGTAIAIVSYEGEMPVGTTLAVEFKVNPLSLKAKNAEGESQFTVVVPEYTYTGKAIQAKPLVICDETELVEGVDYTLTYKNNVKAAESTAKAAPTVTIKGIGRYKDSVSATFTINPISETVD